MIQMDFCCLLATLSEGSCFWVHVERTEADTAFSCISLKPVTEEHYSVGWQTFQNMFMPDRRIQFIATTRY